MKQISIIFISLVLLFSTGCTVNGKISNDFRPIEQLKLVHTVGFDLHDDGLEISVCAGEGETDGLVRMSASGGNISDAVSTLQNFSGKEELYYAHTRYILVGEAFAEHGLENVLEYLETSAQLRTDLPLFIVKGGSAKDLILNADDDKTGIFDILDAVMRDCTRRGDSFPFSCGDIGSITAEYGSATACALTVSPTKPIDPQAKEDALTPMVAGYGVLRDGRLVGYIPEDSAKGINLLLNQLGTGELTESLCGQVVSLRITKVDTTLDPDFGSAGTLTGLTVKMDIEATLEERENDTLSDESRLSNALAKEVKAWLTDILYAMRTTQSDFLGLLPRIAVKYPNEFDRSPLDWREQLKTLPMEAEVRCTVTPGKNEAHN